MSDIGYYDSSDPVAADNAAKEQVRREAQDDATMAVWMNHPNGRDLLFRLVFESCHMDGRIAAIDGNGCTDTHRTFQNLGECNIGALVDGWMRRHPVLYMKMLDEQEVERQLRNSRLLKQNEKKDERDGD